ncbi:MAG: A/G-specific adenine glycosylase [Chlamydiota bacterium]
MIDTALLQSWFAKNARDFPWRHNRSPYSVWISEVMLQQTRAVSVIPYFIRWMERYPTIQDLAKAPFSEVIKLWEGLGYYSRVRNLHSAAQEMIENFQGVPHTEEALKKIRGFGPYTIGAVLSFAFHKKAVAIDGNVTRVLTRFFLIKEDISKAVVKNSLGVLAEDILKNEKKPWVITEALIELGALVCIKKPKCSVCPLREKCKAFISNEMEQIPRKKPKPKTVFLQRVALMIQNQGKVLVQKGEGKKLMADLYEFPYFEVEDELSLEEVEEEAFRIWGIRLEVQKKHEPIQQSFTKYKVVLYPFLLEAFEKINIPGFSWVSLEELQRLPFSSGHRKMKDQFFGKCK